MAECSKFASGERKSPAELEKEFKIIGSIENFKEILNAVSGLAAVINDTRQIIYANQEFLNLLGADSIEAVLGRRPGEVIGCLHAFENPGGCGTAESCRVCGAVNAVLECQKSGRRASRETKISAVINGTPVQWDLWITAVPLETAGGKFTVITLSDISGEVRAAGVEKMFFHDVLKSAENLHGLIKKLRESEIPQDLPERRELLELSEGVSRELLDDILLCRRIRLAENGDLQVKKTFFSARDFMKDCLARVVFMEAAQGRIVELAPFTEAAGPQAAGCETDPSLLGGIIRAMLKNALEATAPGGVVRAGIAFSGDRVRFWVHNASSMPAASRLQVFQRAFSTKAGNRGLGTYMMKLVGERFLGGAVGFESSEESGTTFFIDIGGAGRKAS